MSRYGVAYLFGYIQRRIKINSEGKETKNQIVMSVVPTGEAAFTVKEWFESRMVKKRAIEEDSASVDIK